ncbi:hypothetical protein D3C72_2331520 [compost metagenome]
MHVEHGADRVQEILARLLFVVDEGAGQAALAVALGAGHLHGFGVLHLVQAIDARLDRDPLQEMRQPARRDGSKLGNGLGRVG